MKRIFLQIAVFIGGAAVMIIEIVGSRLVAPYLGGSLIVWTTLIGVILAALSLGYWLGGKLADARPSPQLFGVLISAAALLVIAIVWFSLALRPLAIALVHNIGLAPAALLLTIILFALPSIMFGMITPFALCLAFKEETRLGQTAGSLYALSTIGSIAGTFVAGFLFIPTLGSFKTLVLISLVLALTSLLFFRRLIAWLVLLIIAVTLTIVFLKPTLFFPYPQTVTDQESFYNRLFIVTSIDQPTKRPTINIMSGPRLAQAGRFTDSDNDLVFPYAKFFRLDNYFNPAINKTLMIGGGAYTIAGDYLKRWPEATIDVVEIDPLYTKLAQEYFNLRPNPRLNIYHQDARLFLNDTAEKYEVIFVDAFSGSGSVPFQLATREAITEIYETLADQGVVIVNLIGSITGPGSDFIMSEYATYDSVFNEVKLFPLGANPAGLQNVMLVALKNLPWPTTTAAPEQQSFLDLELKDVKTTPRILTDDWAPVDYFLAGVL